jgi:hypothetical protein
MSWHVVGVIRSPEAVDLLFSNATGCPSYVKEVVRQAAQSVKLETAALYISTNGHIDNYTGYGGTVHLELKHVLFVEPPKAEEPEPEPTQGVAPSTPVEAEPAYEPTSSEPSEEPQPPVDAAEPEGETGSGEDTQAG